MRKLIAILTLTILCGCGNDAVLGGRKYETVGLLSSPGKNKRVVYKPILGNIVWGSLLIETIAAPIYFFGFSMYEPVRLKDSTDTEGD